MSLSTKYRIEDGYILREYLTEDGAPGIHCIPMEAVSSRMELLGLSDPGQVLDAILQESEITDGTNIYGPVYLALAQNHDPAAVQAEARAALPLPLGPDDRETTQIKTLLATEYGEQIHEAREKFRQDLIPPLPEGAPDGS